MENFGNEPDRALEEHVLLQGNYTFQLYVYITIHSFNFFVTPELDEDVTMLCFDR